MTTAHHGPCPGLLRRSSRVCRLHYGSSNRKATVSVMVMLVLLLLMGLIVSQVRRVLGDHRQVNKDLYHLQAEHLAFAGLQKAAAAWTAQDSYTGEQWLIPPGTVHQTNTGSVLISVSADGQCQVVSRYPTNHEIPFQVTRTQRLSK